MISASIVLIALAVLASLGCWLLMRGLWPEGERDFRAYGLAATVCSCFSERWDYSPLCFPTSGSHSTPGLHQ